MEVGQEILLEVNYFIGGLELISQRMILTIRSFSIAKNNIPEIKHTTSMLKIKLLGVKQILNFQLPPLSPQTENLWLQRRLYSSRTKKFWKIKGAATLRKTYWILFVNYHAKVFQKIASSSQVYTLHRY